MQFTKLLQKYDHNLYYIQNNNNKDVAAQTSLCKRFVAEDTSYVHATV